MSPDPSNLHDPTSWISTIVSSLAATGLGFLWLRRKLSRDNLELVKDRAEENIIKNLESERDKAVEDKEKILLRFDALNNERMEALNKVSKLTIEVEHLTNQIQVLKELVEKLNSSLETARAEINNYAIQNGIMTERIIHLEEVLSKVNGQ